MLHDPELNEAYQTLQNLPPARLSGLEQHHYINELTSATMRLLRAIDKLGDLHKDFRNLDAALEINKAILTKMLDHIHTN